MISLSLRAFPFLFVTALIPYIANAQVQAVPDSLSFQGFLTDSTGAPIDTPSVSITFNLYKGGPSVWSETHPSVSVENGIFNVVLGGTTELGSMPFDTALELGITVGGDSEISPRTPLTSGAYARALPGMVTKYHINGDDESYDVIGGADNNSVGATAVGATISGGGGIEGGNSVPNQVSGRFGTVGGGASNFVGIFSTVAGGFNNGSSFQYVSIGGGRENKSSNQYTTISGGWLNEADGAGAAIGGGFGNMTNGKYATIPGGAGNVATGGYSFAAGRKANALHSGTFVWADSNSTNGTTFSSTGEDQFLVRAIGGVGIGTNAPTNQLSVFGNADVSEKLGIGDTAPRAMVTVRGPNSATNGPIMFMYGDGPDQVESGRIRFVEATASGNKRGGYIHYDGSANRLYIGTVNADNFDVNSITIKRSNRFVGIGVDPSERLHVNGNALADAHTLTSDARLKENVVSLENALGIVGALRGVRFDWKQDMGDLAGEGADIGVIAQEVAEVVPEVVYETGSGYLSVDYAKLVPVLIEAIKAQQADIQQLRAAMERAGIQ